MMSVNRKRGAARQALLVGLIVLFVAAVASVPAIAVETTFTIDENQSDLTIDASTTVFSGIPLSDSDTQGLGGTIDALFEFGATGAFPTTADFNVTSSAISPLQPFALALGLPQVLGVSIDVTGAVAEVTTPNPPVTLNRLAGPQIVYEFDASGFDVTLNQGTVVTSGAVSEPIDLAANPVTGSAPVGTIGSLTLTPTGMSGPYTMVDATLALPIFFMESIDAGDQQVDLVADGIAVATSSFFVALSGLPGDFDGDLDVDGDDLTGAPLGWGTRYGTDLDGGDFLTWQRYYGIEPPTQISAASVPEPAALLLAALAAGGLGLARSRQSLANTRRKAGLYRWRRSV